MNIIPSGRKGFEPHKGDERLESLTMLSLGLGTRGGSLRQMIRPL